MGLKDKRRDKGRKGGRMDEKNKKGRTLMERWNR